MEQYNLVYDDKQVQIYADDARTEYEVVRNSGHTLDCTLADITFRTGPLDEYGLPNGVTVQNLLIVAKDKLEHSKDNTEALEAVNTAIAALERRIARRKAEEK